MNRRGFLQTCLALAAAPAIVRADSLMRVVPRETVLIPAAWGLSGNGRHLYQFHEVLIFNTAHTDTERKVVESYLLRKNPVLLTAPPTAWYRFDGNAP